MDRCTKRAKKHPSPKTIDTEPDDARSLHLNPSVANLQELRRVQTLLERYGARATCLITYRVFQDDGIGTLERPDRYGSQRNRSFAPESSGSFGYDRRLISEKREIPANMRLWRRSR